MVCSVHSHFQGNEINQQLKMNIPTWLSCEPGHPLKGPEPQELLCVCVWRGERGRARRPRKNCHLEQTILLCATDPGFRRLEKTQCPPMSNSIQFISIHLFKLKQFTRLPTMYCQGQECSSTTPSNTLATTPCVLNTRNMASPNCALNMNAHQILKVQYTKSM